MIRIKILKLKNNFLLTLFHKASSNDHTIILHTNYLHAKNRILQSLIFEKDDADQRGSDQHLF